VAGTRTRRPVSPEDIRDSGARAQDGPWGGPDAKSWTASYLGDQLYQYLVRLRTTRWDR